MKAAPKHPQEDKRLESLHHLKILDTLPEKDFDDLTRIASQICEVPIALVSLIDESRQWFKSKQGVELTETPRELSFCAHTIIEDSLMVVPDARKDERFWDNPFVTGNSEVVFYAGSPIISPDGYPVGTLCVIDHKPRQLSESQKSMLQFLSQQIARLLDLRLQIQEKNHCFIQLMNKQKAIENLIEGVFIMDKSFNISRLNSATPELFGLIFNQLNGNTGSDSEWKMIREDGSPFPISEFPAYVALRTGKDQCGVLVGFRGPNYESRWVKINSTTILDSEDSQPSHAITSLCDVTLEKNTLFALKRSESEFKRIVNGIPALIGHWDRNLINISANKAYSEYGSLEELVGDFCLI